ncbi:MAG: inverse autotransporter beta domain-containing protein [Candidatus Thiodiazotropha sp. (ex Gloverina cf. vestifex)]|nr:inverse autotransporter beta domain-containing protein [Candidatus Thiodiazotropha sp. (ex Gloverina cf. vestifex)]
MRIITTLIFALIPQIAFAIMLPFKLGNTSVMFVDFQAENGSQAEEDSESRMGVLYRWLSDSHTVEGLYSYIDNNKSPNNNSLKRFVLGYESLSDHWSYRINGYIPTKNMKRIKGSSKLYIKGHSVYEEQSAYYEQARPGLELSASYTLPYLNNAKAHINGYTFWSRYGTPIIGKSVRLEKQIKENVEVFASLRHDSAEGWDNSVGIKLHYNLDGVKKKPSVNSIFKKMAVPIQIQDRVPSYRIYKHNDNDKPDMKKPLKFFGKIHEKMIFVDNQAQPGGDGTREHPYNNLKDAEKNSDKNELIYVLYGDGTSNAYGSSFSMKEGQSLVGSGVGLTMNGQGLIKRKKDSDGKTLRTKLKNNNSKLYDVVALDDDTDVHGFSFATSGTGIFGKYVNRVFISNNTFESSPDYSGGADGWGIELWTKGKRGPMTANIYDNDFNLPGGIYVSSKGKPKSPAIADPHVKLDIIRNTFSDKGSQDIKLSFGAKAKHQVNLRLNKFGTTGRTALQLNAFDNSVDMTIIGNIFNTKSRDCALCFSLRGGSSVSVLGEMNAFYGNKIDIEVSVNGYETHGSTVFDFGGGSRYSIGLNSFSNINTWRILGVTRVAHFKDNNYWGSVIPPDALFHRKGLPWGHNVLSVAPDFLGCLENVIEQNYDGCPDPVRRTSKVKAYADVDVGTQAAIDYLTRNGYEWTDRDCTGEDCTITPGEFFSKWLASDPKIMEETILGRLDDLIHKKSILSNIIRYEFILRAFEYYGYDDDQPNQPNKNYYVNRQPPKKALDYFKYNQPNQPNKPNEQLLDDVKWRNINPHDLGIYHILLPALRALDRKG